VLRCQYSARQQLWLPKGCDSLPSLKITFSQVRGFTGKVANNLPREISVNQERFCYEGFV